MCRGKGGVLQMIATRDIAVGEEVVNNYGELSQVTKAGQPVVLCVEVLKCFIQ